MNNSPITLPVLQAPLISSVITYDHQAPVYRYRRFLHSDRHSYAPSLAPARKPSIPRDPFSTLGESHKLFPNLSPSRPPALPPSRPPPRMARLNIPPLTRTCLLICTCLSILTGALRYRARMNEQSQSDSSGESEGHGQFFTVPYLTVVPALSIVYPWTFVTSSLIETNVRRTPPPRSRS